MFTNVPSGRLNHNVTIEFSNNTVDAVNFQFSTQKHSFVASIDTNGIFVVSAYEANTRQSSTQHIEIIEGEICIQNSFFLFGHS